MKKRNKVFYAKTFILAMKTKEHPDVGCSERGWKRKDGSTRASLPALAQTIRTRKEAKK